jgi:predicted ferric reductase
MSFTLFPASRNSLWESVFGIPFERAIKYHRIVGVLAYLTVTAHMLLWFVKWGKEQNLLHNLLSLNELRISKEVVHWDNFTIPLVELVRCLSAAPLPPYRHLCHITFF